LSDATPGFAMRRVAMGIVFALAGYLIGALLPRRGRAP
jgi:hypothetical protein